CAGSSPGAAAGGRGGQGHPPGRAPAPRGRNGTTRWSSSLALERSEGTASPGLLGRAASIGAPASDFKQNRRLWRCRRGDRRRGPWRTRPDQKIAFETTKNALSEPSLSPLNLR